MVVIQKLLAGGVAGGLATLPMSAVVWGFRKLGVYRSKPAPEAIAEGILDRAGQYETAHGTSGVVLKMASHLGFGAAAGALYGLVSTMLRPTLVTGAASGLAVWKSNYDTWIPAAGILPPPEHDEHGRQATMVAAHLVYGVTLGYLTGRLERMLHAE